MKWNNILNSFFPSSFLTTVAEYFGTTFAQLMVGWSHKTNTHKHKSPLLLLLPPSILSERQLLPMLWLQYCAPNSDAPILRK